MQGKCRDKRQEVIFVISEMSLEIVGNLSAQDGRVCRLTPYMGQIREMADKAKTAGLNIDYFPTNFVVQNGLIYYIDYECNEYMDEWNFENWGIKYWSKTPEFIEYLNNKR